MLCTLTALFLAVSCISANELIQCNSVNGTSSTVVTNPTYNIIESVSGRALFGNYYKNDKTNHYKVEKWPVSEDQGKYSKWSLAPAEGNYYNIIEKVSGRALYGNYYKNDKTNHYKVEKWPLSEDSGAYSKWKLVSVGDGFYNIIEKVSQRALYGNYYKNDKTNHYKVEKWPTTEDGGKYSKWKFVPTGYEMSAELSDFEILGDPELLILSSPRKIDLIDRHVAVVTNENVGAEISRTYSKTITETFSWGLDQRIGVHVSVEGKIGLPLISSMKTTIEGSFEFGSNQQWTKTRERTMSTEIRMTPNKPGKYVMSGFVESIDDAEFKFKATVRFKATQNNFSLSHQGVLALFQHEKLDAIVWRTEPDAVLAHVTGTLKASYGLVTTTKFE